MIDLTILWHALASLLSAMIIGVMPILATRAMRLMNVSSNAVINTAIADATKRAAGIAYTALLTATDGVNISTHNAAVAAGVNHVLAAMPSTLQAAGITSDTVTRMVSGELGRLLAADPTIGPSAATAAPAALPAAAPAPHAKSVLEDGWTGAGPLKATATTLPATA